MAAAQPAQQLTNVEIKFDRPSKIYRLNETVSGTVTVTTKTELKHEGIFVELFGSVNMQPTSKSGVFESFYNNLKPIELTNWSQEICKNGKIGTGRSEFPFQFILEQKSNKILYETYHGVYIAIQYVVKCEIKRSFPSKSIMKNGEFLFEYKDQAEKALEKPISFTITPDSVQKSLKYNLGKFYITGRIDSCSCLIDKPLTGEIIIHSCDRQIRSVELQLIRVETIGANESYTKEISEIQTIQIGDGDVQRQISIPMYMIFPRLFTCPTLETPNFRIEFEINVVVVFADDYMIAENFPITLHRV